MGEMAELERDDFDTYDLCDARTLGFDRIDEIEHGFWRDKEGKLHKICEMKSSHIQNIVNLLNRNDVEIPSGITLEMEFRQQKGIL